MTDPAHHVRKHFAWAASDSAANWTCAGKIALCAIFPEQPEAEYAARGTAVHECNDKALMTGADPGDYLGDVIKTEAHEITITEKEVESSRLYVEFIRSLPGKLLVEQKFELTRLDTPFPSGGTVDAALLDLPNRRIHIVDYKNGTGYVDANDNKQLRTYALCYLLDLPDDVAAQIDTITSTIVQPNVSGEAIRSETYHKVDLLDWAADMLVAMSRSKQAEIEFAAIGDNKILLEEWSDKWLVTGHCKFCNAAGGCPKRRKEALAKMPELARRWHEDVTLETQPALSNLAKLGSAEELAHDLDGFDELEAWIASRRAYAHAQAEAGVEVPGYQLVEKIGNRRWIDETKAADGLSALGLTEKQIFKASLLSPAQAEKVLGKRKTEIASLTERPTRGTNLVSASKTTRPKVKTMAEAFHEQVEN